MITSLSQTNLVTRASIARLQAELARAQQELASGRHSDIGRSYGARSVAVSSIRGNIADLQAITDGNKIASARLSASGNALESIMSVARSVQQQLLNVGSGVADGRAIGEAGLAALNQTISICNTTFNGVYLFAGLNDGAKPLNEFRPGAANGPSEQLRQAFQSQFGRLPGDQGNAAIAVSDMKSFLDTTFSQMFSSDQRKNIWSSASDVGAEFRISQTESLRYPAIGNSSALRDLVQSLTMIAGLGLETLNADTRQLAIDRAAATLGNALAEFSAVVGQVGISQNAAEAANQRLSSQHVQLAARLDELESIDPAEVAIRISSLSEQLQASYQVTTKLAHLSLVNFI